MDLGDLLLYLARGALTAFEVIIGQLSQADLKSLRYVSFEVSDILVPYLFDKSEELYISAYGPDLHVAQAVLNNSLLSHRVRTLVWDYSTIDHELLRYAWYHDTGRKVTGDEWQDICELVYDHTNILANGIDVRFLERALSSLPRLISIHVANCNLYHTTLPTCIVIGRRCLSRSPTTAMLKNGLYCIMLLESAIPSLPSWLDLTEVLVHIQKQRSVPGSFQNLLYMGDPGAPNCCQWVFRASPDRVIALLTAMAQVSDLQLQEFVVSSSKGSECGKEEAWARAFRQCSRDTLAAWTSRFATVEKLHLFMDDGGHIETRKMDRHCLQACFGPVLQVASGLEDLQVTGVEWNVIAMLNAAYPRLRRLYIEIANLGSESLTEFCRRHVAKLQVLDIRNSQLTGGMWQHFLLDLTDGTVLPFAGASSDASSTTEGQTLNVRLHKVFEDVKPQYQGAHCVFEKLVFQRSRSRTVEVRLRHGEDDLRLRPLQLRLSRPLESYCRIHRDDNLPYIFSSGDRRWRPISFDLVDYK